VAPHLIVLFGAGGDLARRKLLPGLYHLARARLLRDHRVLGVDLGDRSAEEFRGQARSAVTEFGRQRVDDEELERFLDRVDVVSIDDGPAALAEAAAAHLGALGAGARVLHYLSVPPAAALEVIGLVDAAGLVESTRIIMEKPFGTDLRTARALNAALHETFDESQIFRIDHFLGKEAALNILAFRFANGLFEPIWNRQHIDHVQIDVPETLGLGQRTSFYESTGAYRDMVVTHLFQVLAFTAMEPPTDFTPLSISEEKQKVFRSMLPIQPTDVVRGQYGGYRDEPGVDPHSDTETFVAMELAIDTWRWAGVPFLIRTGKALAQTVTEACVVLHSPPKLLFSDEGEKVESNRFRFRLGPDAMVQLELQFKAPGEEMRSRTVDLDVDGRLAPSGAPAYERLLGDVIEGDARLFARQDTVEESLRVVQPILDDPRPVVPYFRDSWGPPEAFSVVPGDDDWIPSSAPHRD